MSILDKAMVQGLLALLVPGFVAAIADYNGGDALKRKFCLQVQFVAVNASHLGLRSVFTTI